MPGGHCGQLMSAPSTGPSRGGIEPPAALSFAAASCAFKASLVSAFRRLSSASSTGGAVGAAAVASGVRDGSSPPPSAESVAAAPGQQHRRQSEGGGESHSFSHTDTCASLSAVNGVRSHHPHRSRSRIPASRAIRSNSAGQA